MNLAFSQKTLSLTRGSITECVILANALWRSSFRPRVLNRLLAENPSINDGVTKVTAAILDLPEGSIAPSMIYSCTVSGGLAEPGQQYGIEEKGGTGKRYLLLKIVFSGVSVDSKSLDASWPDIFPHGVFSQVATLGSEEPYSVVLSKGDFFHTVLLSRTTTLLEAKK